LRDLNRTDHSPPLQNQIKQDPTEQPTFRPSKAPVPNTTKQRQHSPKTSSKSSTISKDSQAQHR
jgi:hypothetical protein